MWDVLVTNSIILTEWDSYGSYLLDHPVFAGGEVVFGGVDERNPEVEEQVDDQGPGVLCQEDLQVGRDGGGQRRSDTVPVTALSVLTHRDPADLGPQIPEVEGGRRADGKMLQNVLILQRLPF